jgi:hypothetical protein
MQMGNIFWDILYIECVPSQELAAHFFTRLALHNHHFEFSQSHASGHNMYKHIITMHSHRFLRLDDNQSATSC